MNHRSKLFLLGSLVAMSTACDERDTVGHTTPPIVSPVRFAVRHGDFASTSISLLGHAGEVLADDYINSGTTKPGLTATISGDVDLPTTGEPGILTLIDRYGTDVVTRIRLEDGVVLGQVRTQEPSSSDYSSNPQDLLYVDSRTAWVSRWGHNTQPSAPGILRGSDLLIIDPTTMERTGGRIDLSSLGTTVDFYGEETAIRVRPRKIVRVGHFAAVGLDMLSDGTPYILAAGPGRLAIVDTRNGAIAHLDLPPFKNCGSVSPVPGQSNQIAVMCQGWYGETRDEEAGLLILAIDPDVGTVTEVRRYALADHPGEDNVFDGLVMIDADEFIGIHIGGWMATDPPDTIVHVDMVTAARTVMLTSAKANEFFVQPAFDPVTGLLLIPDTVDGGVRRFQRAEDGSFTEGERIVLDGHGLPARAVVLLY